MLALLGVHHILHVIRVRVKSSFLPVLTLSDDVVSRREGELLTTRKKYLDNNITKANAQLNLKLQFLYSQTSSLKYYSEEKRREK